MQVSVMSATQNPIDTISMAAGVCYGRGDTVSVKRLETCYRLGHMSVFEHASATFRVEGISRACMAQLTRHRLCSFCVESQRYKKYNLSGDDWYVMPPSIRHAQNPDIPDDFHGAMVDAAYEYQKALENGIKPEDARYLLPEATKTNLVMTCNVRELYHVLDMRQDGAAQWEIRALADEIEGACKEINGEWRKLMEVRS